MEKRESESLAKQLPRINDRRPNTPPSPAENRAEASRKPSREDVSRCISIWARMYRLQDEQTDLRDLCLPARPWLGRSPNSLKRFE